MRALGRLAMATPTAAAAQMRPEALALLPPIPLYRRLLRAHRKLPPEMRLLGDEYVKSEFRAHRNVENPIHIVGFLTQWQLYAQKIEGDAWRDHKMDKATLDKMSDDQIAQLYKLMQTIQNPDAEDDSK
ncbi:hypothetical protein BDY21DRAFT_187325 [Lineolata rhizophorae]|uniref:Succinate dehydrogenase assembly factor 3 n=1 Tax=Lineolata rhizophorae TaxID=578093 RepID=A0A6A6P5I5_9PEZI|nr:hypothetical protein BDY21DRAFT_187325 [Lineolata rhizophorae]